MTTAMTAPPSRTSPARSVPDDPRWDAVVARDRASDEVFWYSVKTTGVYCRPSCGARLPKRQNVRFHDTRAAAEREGVRPCKRCRPDRPSVGQQDPARVAAACRQIDAAEAPPSLGTLARRAGLSPYHFHRVFKAVTGLTPRAYAAARRARRVRDELARRATVTEAIFESGFNSSGRFYAASGRMLGMTPGDYRAGGADVQTRRSRRFQAALRIERAYHASNRGCRARSRFPKC
jgi:AraC family transcriptional regulator of adaptative response/methylated-DNA-[protein]-cysteine methyltransferase